MKNLISHARQVVAAGAVCFLSVSNVLGEEPSAAQQTGATPAPAAAVQVPATTQPSAVAQPAVTAQAAPTATFTAVKLPYGVDDVLKLSRSSISEDIILNYIQNSGTIYNLSPQDIVYLRNEGVSDRVVSAMLGQRKQVEAAAAAQANTQAQPAVAYAPPVPYAATVADATTAQVAPTFDDSAQAAQPASSVYVIPYPQATAAYYGAYSSPYGYYGYYGPSIAIGFGYGYYGRGYCGPRYYHGYSHGHGWHH